MTPAAAPVRPAAAAWRAGTAVAGSVLGAGLLVVPPVVLTLAGAGWPRAWLVHLGLGAMLCATLGLAGMRRRGRSLFDVAGELGRGARRALTATYLAGFVVGQAALAMFAGQVAAAAVSHPLATPLAVGSAVLALATLAVLTERSLGRRGRGIRLALTLVVAVALFAGPSSLVQAGLVVTGGGELFWVAAAAAFFAGVGWESMARHGAGLRNAGGVAVAAVVAVAIVALAYLPLSWLLAAAVEARTVRVSSFAPVVALSVAGVLGLYCLTNIGAAAGFARSLGVTSRRTPIATGAAAVAVLTAAEVLGWEVWQLLLGPALAAWIGYLLAGFAVLRSGPASARLPALVQLGSLLLLMVGAVSALAK